RPQLDDSTVSKSLSSAQDQYVHGLAVQNKSSVCYPIDAKKPTKIKTATTTNGKTYCLSDKLLELVVLFGLSAPESVKYCDAAPGFFVFIAVLCCEFV